MSFDHLKKVPPIDNPAPDIRPGDKRWSDVFEEAAKIIKKRREDYLCHAIAAELGFTSNQAERMQNYIFGLMPTTIGGIRIADFRAHYVVSDWVGSTSGREARGATNFRHYRAAWARHLAAQFRAKGL